MKPERQNEAHHEPGEGTDLWRAVAPLVIWACHFLFCYILMAIVCEKSGRAATFGDARVVIIGATLAALVLIAVSALGLIRAYRRSLTDDDFEFEHNTPEERHRFLSHMALMLSVLGAVGVVYAAMPVFVLESCR